jgi:hypothetical protein
MKAKLRPGGLTRAAEAAGYDAVAWMAPEEADFHQPLMTARASS